MAQQMKVDTEYLDLCLGRLEILLGKQVEQMTDFQKKSTLKYNGVLEGDMANQVNNLGTVLSEIDTGLCLLMKNTHAYLSKRKQDIENLEAEAQSKAK